MDSYSYGRFSSSSSSKSFSVSSGVVSTHSDSQDRRRRRRRNTTTTAAAAAAATTTTRRRRRLASREIHATTALTFVLSLLSLVLLHTTHTTFAQQTAQKAVQRVTVTEDQPQPSTFLLVDTNTNTTWPTNTTFAPACQPRSASKFQLSKSDGIFEYQPSPDKFSTTANDVDVFSYEAVRVNEQGRLVRAAALVEVYIEPRNDAPAPKPQPLTANC